LLDALLIPFAHNFGKSDMIVHKFYEKTIFLL